MALAKFNAFHWHIVDDDSFPMEVQAFPNLEVNGAFSEHEVYSKKAMQDLVAHAQTLGIRVIPEFDNPGHTRAVGLDPEFKDVILCFDKEWPNNLPNAFKIYGGPPTGVLDPSKDKTYDLLKGIFETFKEFFPDNMVHLGGDEVFTSCFNENPHIQTFMKSHGLSTYKDLINYHLEKTRTLLKSVNPNFVPLYWSNEATFYQTH